MLEEMLRMFTFGCRHSHMSKPFSTEVARQDEVHLDWVQELPPCSHYVVCLDCGRRFAYDWETMKVIKTRLKPAS